MNQITETADNALAIVGDTSIVALFNQPDEIEKMIERIEAEATAEAPDLSTKKGREAIASLAYKVARTKTALDKAGADLNSDLRAKINVVDAERRKIRDRLDQLKAKIRAPLDKWEADEAARQERIKSMMAALDGPDIFGMSAAEISEAIAAIEKITIDQEFGEFEPIAVEKKKATLSRLAFQRDREIERDRLIEEAAKLRAEAEAREAAAAKAEADRIAREKAEADRIAAQEAEAQRQRDLEKARHEAAQRAQREAEERAQAEADRVARETEETKARHAAQLAEAKRQAEEAAQRERDRIAAERQAEADAAAKRAADQAHRDRIKSEIAAALATLKTDDPALIADAIMAGKIPHVKALI
jgi:hypothetical protein